MYSKKGLGCFVEKNKTIFRLFAPRATEVILILFQKHEDEKGEELEMKRDAKKVWEYAYPKALTGTYYGYRVSGPAGAGEMFNPKILIGDPYSKAVTTINNYHHPAKTLILDTSYDWEGDDFVISSNHNELIIYEAHVRDLTAHRSSRVMAKGTYLGLSERGKTGGLSYLKDLGVNAIELLPIQKFGTIEPPYGATIPVDKTDISNNWNPYERNHWGYMTSYYFAPETYYASDGTMEREKYSGIDGRAVKELKDMVKAFHREGIAVILDVVFNHVSQYDYNPLKYVDKLYYFHCDSSGNFMKHSGCGNDFRTDRPMSRRLIVDCIKYWMQEYHIDGFRFDLATMIDWETCKQVYAEAKKINPDVILIAEPWGGGKYSPDGFSYIDWAAWNDLFRDGVKGRNPKNGLGFIFGAYYGYNTKESLTNYITGTLREKGGLFLKKEHSVNYLESHDDYALGDFIRLGTGEARDSQPITDISAHVKLTPKQLAINKLAALFLFTSQGLVMIHEGQEFARSKVVVPAGVPDPHVGMIDHNSYEKDNDTNYLNYTHRDINRELYEYYKGLIALRRRHPIFCSAPRKAVQFFDTEDNFLIAFKLGPTKFPGKQKRFIVALNGNPQKSNDIVLPPGTWNIIADAEQVGMDEPMRTVTGKVVVPPTSGLILMENQTT